QQAAGDQVLALGELERLEGAQRVGDRQRDILGDGAAFDADGEALGAESIAVAIGTGSQRTIRFQQLTLAPGAGVETSTQVGDQAFEPFAERIVLPLRALALLARLLRAVRLSRGAVLGDMLAAVRAKQQQIALLFRQLCERHVQVDAERLAQSLQRGLNQRLITARPWSNSPFRERLRLVGYDTRRIKVERRAESLTGAARAMRRVERERARRHLRDADAAIGAGQASREQPIAARERVDDDDIVGQFERDPNRIRQPALDAGL